MKAKFWHERWQNNQIGFHQRDANPMLDGKFHLLALRADDRVFVPLCGKTRDIAWLLSHGFRVVGAELSELAIKQLFADLDITPQISPSGPMQHYHAAQIDIFVGDIFDLSREMIGPVDAVYDRAALVALPPDMRGQYARHVSEITQNAPQFLLTFEYSQDLVDGPPFSVDAAELLRVYGPHYGLNLVASLPIEGGLKGRYPASEHVWLLR